VSSTISRPNKILVAFIKAALTKRVLHPKEWTGTALAEKPKVGELQMDWLRSEDLKEEKNVTAPIVIIALHASIAP
jgi:hypothetical protein